ncbi:hypothetical protein pb186bvf_005962 [Paramecium bursaria]
MEFQLNLQHIVSLLSIQNKSQRVLKNLYNLLADFIGPICMRLNIASFLEILNLINHLEYYEVQAGDIIEDTDGCYLLLLGKIEIHQQPQVPETEWIQSRSKLFKRRASQIMDLSPGQLIDRSNIYKAIVLSNSYLLHLPISGITNVQFKRESLLRQKRYFLTETLVLSQFDRLKLYIDEWELFYYEKGQNIFTQGSVDEYMYIIYSGDVHLQTLNNTLATLHSGQFFNEDCGSTGYNAKVMSEYVQAFKISKKTILLLPEKARKLIENSRNQKLHLRQSLVDKHIIDIQCPITQRLTQKVFFKRTSPFTPMAKGSVTKKIKIKKVQTDGDSEFEKLLFTTGAKLKVRSPEKLHLSTLSKFSPLSTKHNPKSMSILSLQLSLMKSTSTDDLLQDRKSLNY